MGQPWQREGIGFKTKPERLMHARSRARTRAHSHTHIQVHTHTHTHAYTHSHMYTHTDAGTHTHTGTHTHARTHARTPPLSPEILPVNCFNSFYHFVLNGFCFCKAIMKCVLFVVVDIVWKPSFVIGEGGGSSSSSTGYTGTC